MQVYPMTKPVNTHTLIDRTIKTKVAWVAKTLGVPQNVVFNSLLATGLKVTHVGDTKAVTRKKAPRRKAKRTTR